MKSKPKLNLIMLVTVIIIASLAALYMYLPEDSKKIAGENKAIAAETISESNTTNTDYPLAPDFALADINGNIVNLSDYKGKVVFVNFWATWCPPCRAEIPHFIELVEEFKDDFIVLGISVDRPNDKAKVPGFAENYNINYPVLFADEQIAAYGNISSIPTTFVVDKEGYVKGRIIGARPKEEFKRIITAEL
jgi:thiol-disulfide isomerase/thioredoxin